jgi:hypothetical protein
MPRSSTIAPGASPVSAISAKTSLACLLEMVPPPPAPRARRPWEGTTLDSATLMPSALRCIERSLSITLLIALARSGLPISHRGLEELGHVEVLAGEHGGVVRRHAVLGDEALLLLLRQLRQGGPHRLDPLGGELEGHHVGLGEVAVVVRLFLGCAGCSCAWRRRPSGASPARSCRRSRAPRPGARSRRPARRAAT